MTDNNDSPLIIVDDDSDDREFIQEAWKDLNFSNELIFFNDGEAVIEYMNSGKETPFLIMSDLNLPKMDGFELKAALLSPTATNYKSIPFVFWTTSASENQIRKAYDLGCNGFFIKESSLVKLKESLKEIVNYWKKSKAPVL